MTGIAPNDWSDVTRGGRFEQTFPMALKRFATRSGWKTCLSKINVFSSLDGLELAERGGHIQDKGARPSSPLGQSSHRTRELQRMEAPERGGTAVVNDLLVRAVGALTGGASPREAPPGLRASLHGPDQAWMGVAGHAVTRAPGRGGVGAPWLCIKGTRPAADILPTLGVVVVAVGSTPAATGGRGRAMLIITALQERVWGKVCTARLRVDEGDATWAP